MQVLFGGKRGCVARLMAEFSDYIVYVDESGDHSLTSIDQQFPVFALSFCVVKKDAYMRSIVPAVQALKFKYWGHDAIVLHEHGIRKSKGDFTWMLTNKERREAFYCDLHRIMIDMPFDLIGSVIDKKAHVKTYLDPWSPYDLALQFYLERLCIFLIERGQSGRLIHVVFECRGKREDDDLERKFRQIVTEESGVGYLSPNFSAMEFKPTFAKKSINSTGLQLADLTARPLALWTIRPEQFNRTYSVIKDKLWGMKMFP